MLNSKPDFDIAMTFYELWRGIAIAMFDFIKAVCKLFGVDVDEGKTETEVTE